MTQSATNLEGFQNKTFGESLSRLAKIELEKIAWYDIIGGRSC